MAHTFADTAASARAGMEVRRQRNASLTGRRLSARAAGLGASFLLAAAILVALPPSPSSADDIVLGTPLGTTVTFGAGYACAAQTYTVPAGVTDLSVDAIGSPGSDGQAVTAAAVSTPAPGGTGGLGSEVTGDVAVTPGETLYIGVGDGDGMDGGAGGLGGNVLTPPGGYGVTNPAVGGAGGAASYVSAAAPSGYGGSPGENGCFPSDPLVVAGGGGGGGGGGAWTNCELIGALLDPFNPQNDCSNAGGNGGTFNGSAAQSGVGKGGSDNGGGGQNGGASAGGASGGGGSGHPYLDPLASCTPGYAGSQGGFTNLGFEETSTGPANAGGLGGWGALDYDPTGPCPADAPTNTGGLEASFPPGYLASNTGGGGGGGGGYYGGGGGGGGDDDYGAGGGGGAGASYNGGYYFNGGSYNQIAPSTPTSDPPAVTIVPVATLPEFTGVSDPAVDSCTVGLYCSMSFATTGNPMPTITYQAQDGTQLPSDLSFSEGPDGTATISGYPQSFDVGTVDLLLQASNGTPQNAPLELTISIGYGTLNGISLSTVPSQDLVSGSVATQLTATGMYQSGLQRSLGSDAVWSSTDPSVASISTTGLFTPLSPGTTTIEAADGSESASTTYTVTRGQATAITVTPSNPTVTLGATEQLTATATYLDGTTANVTDSVNWSSDTPSAATVNSTGLVTAVGTTPGVSAGIRATIPYGGGVATVSTPDTVSVSLAHPTSIAVTPANPTVGPGGSEQFKATGTYGTGPGAITTDITSEVTWTSSEPSVVGAEEDGLFEVSAQSGAGSATITATSPDGQVAGTTTLATEAGRPVSIAITPPDGGVPRTLGLGQTAQLTATATYADGSTQNVTSQVDWSTNSPSVVSVSSSGLVTATATTDDYLTALVYATEGGVVAETSFEVLLDNPLSIAVTPVTPTLARGSFEDFTAIGTYPGGVTANITSFVNWSSSNTSYGVMSGPQLDVSTDAGGQTITVTAAATGGPATGATTVSVLLGQPVSLAITLPSGPLGLGQTEQATATATYQNGTTADVTQSATWTSSTPEVATVSSTGLVTAVDASGPYGTSTTVSASFTLPDSTVLQSGNQTLTVNQSNPLSLSVTPATTTLLVGQVQNFVATGHYPGGLTANLTSSVTWSSDSPLLGLEGGSTFVSQVTGTGGTAHVTATLAANGATASVPVTLDDAVSIAGPSSDTTYAGPGYVSPAFTASGGSGSYTWSLQGSYGFSLSATTGSSVSIIGSPTDENSPDYLSVVAADVQQPNNLIFFSFQLTVVGQPQTITVSPTPPATAVVGDEITLGATGGGSGNPVQFGVESLSDEPPCGFDGDTLIFITAGSCVVDANQNGDSTYANAPQVQITITVLGAQTVYFSSAAPSGEVVGSPPTFVTADSATTGTVTLRVDPSTTNDACALADPTSSQAGYASSNVSFDHAGTCVIDANQAGFTGVAPAPQVQQTFTVGQLSQQLTVSSDAPTAGIVGGSYTPSTLPGASGDPVVVSIDATTTDAGTADAACSLSGPTVVLVHAGTCVVDFDEPEPSTADYAASPEVQQSFAVGQATQTVAITTPAAADVGLDETPSATGGPSGNPVTFSVGSGGTTGACTYAGGTLHFAADGTCELDAAQAGSADYQAAPPAALDIAVTQLSLRFRSAPFAPSAHDSAVTPFTLEADDGGGHASAPTAPVTIALSSTSTGAVFAASYGGAPVTSIVLPAGATSVTGYYGDTVAGEPTITAGTVALGSAQQTEQIGSQEPATLTFTTAPVDQVVDVPQSPAVAVRVTDLYDNPVGGTTVTLSTADGPLTGGSATTGAGGVGVFSGLTLGAPGTYTLTAASGGAAHVDSAPFRVFAPLSVTGVSPPSGTSAGGATVTVTGSGFDGAQTVTVGGSTAGFSVVSDSELSVVTPPATSSGPVDVVVANAAETSTVSDADQYTYNPFVPTATTLTVTPATSEPGALVTLKAHVAGDPATFGTPTGTVVFTDGATRLTSAVLGPAGNATVAVHDVPTGASAVVVTYQGDDNYATSSSSAVSHLALAGSTVTLTSSRRFATMGSTATFTARVDGAGSAFGTPTGSVTFEMGTTTLGTSTLDGSGTTTLTTPALTTGLHKITAVYDGDAHYGTASSAPLTQFVYGPVTVAVTAEATSALGTPLAVHIRVAGAPATAGPATGTVTLYDYGQALGTFTLSSGSATDTTSSLALGTHGLWATYGGGGPYEQAYSPTTTVGVDEPDHVTIGASPNPAHIGAVVTLSAHVTSDAPVGVTPSGTVTFMDGTTALGLTVLDSTGTSSMTVSSDTLGIGTDSVTAVYHGDGNFPAATSAPLTQRVTVPSQVTISSVTNPSTVGQQVEIDAQVGGYPLATPRTGTVTLYHGRTALATTALTSTGNVSFLVSSLPFGTNALSATYSGAFPYLGASSGTLLQRVLAAPAVALSSSADPATPGAPVTFTAAVSSAGAAHGTPSGPVTFFDGSTALGTVALGPTGTASFETSSLALGAHTVTARYSGSTTFAPGTSAPLAQTVAGTTTVTLSSSDNPDTDGTVVTLSAQVTADPTDAGPPTGLVTFTEDGQTLGAAAPDGSGLASIEVASNTFEGATGSVTATYGGDALLSGATSAPLEQTVTEATQVKLASSANPTTAGSSVTLTATVVAPQAFAQAPTGTVTFLEGSTVLATASLGSDGTAAYTTGALSAGPLTVTASYSGDAAYQGATSSPFEQDVLGGGSGGSAPSTVSLGSSENPATLGDTVTLTARAAAVGPGATPTGTVTFFYGSAPLGTVNLDGTGSASLPVATSNFGPGTLGFTASYSGDATYATSTSPVLLETVNGSATLTPTSVQVSAMPDPATPGSTVTIEAFVSGQPPTFGPPTGSVTFLDGPTTLGTTPLSVNGDAILTTTALPTGLDPITARYSGDTNYAASTGSGSETVGAASVVTLTSTENPAVAGDAVTFDVAVTGDPQLYGVPTGQVTFFEGPIKGATLLGTATLDGNGDASLTTSTLPVGTDQVFVEFASTSAYSSAPSNIISETVSAGGAGPLARAGTMTARAAGTVAAGTMAAGTMAAGTMAAGTGAVRRRAAGPATGLSLRR